MKRALSLLLLLYMMVSLVFTVSADTEIITTATGYTQASDVIYITQSGTIVNWGARGEDCVFLTTYAQDYYTGNNTYESFAAMDGGTSTSNAYSSELYKALKSFMKSNHDHETSYKETRFLYCYTDCLRNDYKKISSFYSGKTLNGTWDSGKTWNREHTWPNSKGLGGNDENDIMMLRPTSISENTTRGNTAYGEGSGYFDPGVSVRGDCARIVLYVYVRWGNTSYMWGKSGVMESLDVLLKWMEEDPVDTWEMGRNDSVQSITGVRNVFIDYPELAWQLFGKDVPAGMTTPSGSAKNSTPAACTHSSTEIRNAISATCTEAGYTGDTYCLNCGEMTANGTSTSALGHINNDQNNTCDRCGGSVDCGHGKTFLSGSRSATCTENGYTGDTLCEYCNTTIGSGAVIPAFGHKNENGDALCDVCTASVACGHGETELKNALDATCGDEGYTGDTCCVYCGERITAGETIPATGTHNFSEWASIEDLSSRYCLDCGYVETVYHPEPSETEPSAPSATDPSTPSATDPSDPVATAPSTQTDAATPSTAPTEPAFNPPVWPWILAIVLLAGVAVTILVLKKKKA